MFGLNFIKKILKTFQFKRKPHNIALGFALGSIIGLTPHWSLHNLIVFILILILDVSISAAFFGIIFFSCIAHFLDPIFHNLGYFLLVEVPYLKPIWTYLYNIPIAPLTKFYNTVVLGSLVVSLSVFFPVYLGFRQIVKLYQAKMANKINKLKTVQSQ